MTISILIVVQYIVQQCMGYFSKSGGLMIFAVQVITSEVKFRCLRQLLKSTLLSLLLLTVFNLLLWIISGFTERILMLIRADPDGHNEDDIHLISLHLLQTRDTLPRS